MAVEDYTEPVLPGPGASDYERYLRTDELLALQPDPAGEELYQLAEYLTEWDERLTLWRMRHYKVVARIIGDEVIGTQGTPAELLGGLIKQKFFPELWKARNRLTELANEE
jgi:tryptophan 2,3-dioxygenase